MKCGNLIVTMTRSNGIIAVASRELQDPLSLAGRPTAVDSRKIDSYPIEVHADVLPHGTSSLADAELLTAIHASMVLDAALAWTLDIFATLRHAMVMIVVIVHILVPEVIDKHITDTTVRQYSLREVDDSVFDDVRIDTMNMVRLIAANDSVITIKPVHLEFAELIGLDHMGAVLYESILDREVDAKLTAGCVVEVALKLLVLLDTGVPAFFKLIDVGVGDLDLLEADELHGGIGVLVAAGVDVALFVVVELATNQLLRWRWTA